MELMADGSFSFSGGAVNNGFGRLSFNDEGYALEKLSYCEQSFDAGNDKVLFYVDNSESAKEEYLQTLEIQTENIT